MGERFGGQVLDTVDIENYISVPKTEGQKLAGRAESACQRLRR
ncbi:reductase [Salmonella enterica subsp. enterica]|uniref:Reductase n=1 Tax=Salmonella enterica I TaxID=59201 RepID=A0A3S4HGY3_SALET|nr:reductase [Salmonella enterica subsp. enterica]